jgi:phosphonopyruvate decarboxylase
MISCSCFYDFLLKRSIDFFTGVPDSLLKYFCAYLIDHASSKKSIIAANEGNAIALAVGYYLATKKIGAVYMQNSGQGNTVNPLVSLADTSVYSIPILMIIGWRGEPGKKDEPQHLKQGEVTLNLLDILNIPYKVLPESSEAIEEILDEAVIYMQEKMAPYALIVKKGTFKPYDLQNKNQSSFYELLKEEALKLVVKYIGKENIIVSTTGKISRELFEHRGELKEGHSKDFLTIGSMGHASSIALGIAMQKPARKIYCLDGDGAVIMHMGSLATIGSLSPKNFKHIIFNNGAHDSVGGQPTAGFKIDFPIIAKACGYKTVLRAETISEIEERMPLLQKNESPGLLEIRVSRGSRENLSRPTISPEENKVNFMEFLSK